MGWLAALQCAAHDVLALVQASHGKVQLRGFQADAEQDPLVSRGMASPEAFGSSPLGSGGRDAWGTIPADGSPRNVDNYNMLISLMARRRR